MELLFCGILFGAATVTIFYIVFILGYWAGKKNRLHKELDIFFGNGDDKV